MPQTYINTLAGNTAERCAIPMDRQLRLVQRFGFKASTVQGNADFLEVAELLLLVVVIHSKNSFPQNKKAGIRSRIPARKFLVGIKI